MCGIVGIVSDKPVADRIADVLKRLEYRGYDSAGIATFDQGKMDRRRAPGKLTNLKERMETSPAWWQYWYWPYTMGNSWCAYRRECPSAHDRQGRRCT